MENMEGLKSGQFVRSSIPLSNGFRVISEHDKEDILSTIFTRFFKNPSTRKKKRSKSLIHEILKFQNWIVNGEILNLAPSRSWKGLCNWGEFDNWSLVGSLFGSSRTSVTCYYPYSSLKEKLKLNCWKDLKKKLLPPSIKRDESYDDLWEVVELDFRPFSPKNHLCRIPLPKIMLLI